MGGTAAKLVEMGYEVHFVDVTTGEPARHAPPGERAEQAQRAADLLGVTRTVLALQDRLLRDTVETRLCLARIIRERKPSLLFTTHGGSVHPDHGAVTDLVVGAAFYARLPKWNQVPGGTSGSRGPIRTRSIACSSPTVGWRSPGPGSISPWT